MTNLKLAQSIRHGFFANRKTPEEAIEYALGVFRTFRHNEAAATTALMVVLNTLSNEIIKNEQKQEV